MATEVRLEFVQQNIFKNVLWGEVGSNDEMTTVLCPCDICIRFPHCIVRLATSMELRCLESLFALNLSFGCLPRPRDMSMASVLS